MFGCFVFDFYGDLILMVEGYFEEVFVVSLFYCLVGELLCVVCVFDQQVEFLCFFECDGLILGSELIVQVWQEVVDCVEFEMGGKVVMLGY